jgi:hypothetical protein
MKALGSLFAAGGAVLALAFGLALVVRRRRRAARPDLGAFLRECEAEGTPAEVAALVFHALQGWLGDARGGFAVRAGDRLDSVYGIGADEQDETAALLLRRCGRRAEPGRERPALVTAADLARYVASCPPDGGASPA